jgi:hypothetical protein
MNAFVIWANGKYTLQLPTLNDFPAGTMLYQMWSLPVTTAESPSPGVLAKATATTGLTVIAPMSSIVNMEIQELSAIPPNTSNFLAQQQQRKQKKRK